MKAFLKNFTPLLLLIPALNSSASEYCAAIRGNGELMPAHWGAMSKIVQEKGIPKAMAGGSSASITIFLLESLAVNSKSLTNSEYSLLIKSFQGFFETLSQTEEGKAIAAILADKMVFQAINKASEKLDSVTISREAAPLLNKHLRSIQTITSSKDFQKIINPEFDLYLKETIKLSDELSRGNSKITPEMVTYRKNEISKAIKGFGKFNAENDDSLFFRPGLINFKHLSFVFGLMGDFYAGIKLNNSRAQSVIDQDMDTFLKICTPNTSNLTWQQIIKKNPVCRNILGKSVLSYREEYLKEGLKGVRINKRAGDHLAVFPTTSILSGNALVSFNEMKKKYFVNKDPSFGRNFKIATEELHFGYWGNSNTLNLISKNLKKDKLTKNDEKSNRFLPLGSGRWLDILAASPAEPGLSSIVELNRNYASAGGWSDLHPTLVLRAHGCKEIIYVTRKGGESLFAQGIMKRLTDYSGFEWNEWINLSGTDKKHKNDYGNTNDIGPYASEWSQLYNMANPNSSIRKSMRQATTILCTDWNRFDVTKELNTLVEDSFRANLIPGTNNLCR